eukprot:746090-Hanusia_phi.AAC.8
MFCLLIRHDRIVQGQTAVLTVFDADMNHNADQVDVITNTSELLLISTDYPFPGDKEYLYATETGPNTGVFTALIITGTGSLAIPFNGIIEPFVPSYQAVIQYYDFAPRSNVVVSLTSCTIGNLSSAYQSVATGTTLTITVVDADMNSDPLHKDVAQVQVTSSRYGEGIEHVQLVEVGVSTGCHLPADLQPILTASRKFHGSAENLAIVNFGSA